MKSEGMRRRLVAPATLGLLASFAALAILAGPANAGQTHVQLGAFCEGEPTGIGTPPCSPTFSGAFAVAVDQSSGDVLVIESGTKQISRYHKDGTPSPFSELGTNVIDAKGTGECLIVPADCDETPENGLSFDPSFGSHYSQIAVDNSGTETDGNIYVTQNLLAGLHLIDIFASSGKYLGQITGAGETPFGAGPEGILSPCGVAVDPTGNVYAGGFEEDKIYKFDPTANPPKTPKNSDHVATFSAPDPCQLTAGVGPSEGSLFATEFFGPVHKLSATSGALECEVKDGENAQLAVNPADGHLLVADGDAIFEYDASDCPATLISSFAIGNFVAVEEDEGKVYVSRGDEEGHLDVYSGLVPLPDPTTEEASDIGKTTATLNGTVETNGEELTECSFEYGTTTAYGSTVSCKESFEAIGTGTAKVHVDVSGLEEETAYHFRLVAANANGPADPQGKDESFQTRSKPQLLEEWAQDVTLHEARLKARINPQSAETTYHFEWGLAGVPYENSTADIAIGSVPKAQTVSLFLQGLEADTPYHYRVVAKNEMGTSEGPERSFITFPAPPAPDSDCPNQAFRGGDSVLLPDCRAYEMVSPVDKNGADIARTLTGGGNAGGWVQASPDGEKITYTAIFASFAGQPNSFKHNQYLGARGEDGWANEGIQLPVVGDAVGAENAHGFYRTFTAFTPDLCNAWLRDNQNPPATPEGQVGDSNLYRRVNCKPQNGSLEALTPTPEVELPPGTFMGVDRNSMHGVSDDGRHALFIAEAPLTADAHPGVNTQIYDRFCPLLAPEVCKSGGLGHLALVSVLPSGEADPDAAQVGSGYAYNLKNAVSTDGSRVYWGSGVASTGGPGRLYLRLHPEQGIVDEECTDPGKACTLAVSDGPNAFFWQASPDGSKALYDEEPSPGAGADLYEYDLGRQEAGEEPRRPVASDVLGVLGAAEDLSRIYFASREAIAEAGPNSEGEEAIAGEPNVYLAEGGTFAFVGTLVDADVEGHEEGAGNVRAYSPISPFSIEHATRVTPDGSRIAFESRASLTGYDNAAVEDGRAAVEVFTYEAGGELTCVSCNPTEGRPDPVAELREPYAPPFELNPITKVPAAAWIPTWEHSLHASNVLSEDGNRLFFNANDALLPRDNNGAQDVYEWEAVGTGGCDESDADYFPQNGGCLYLISSGENSYESEFWEASTNGDDVFFTTGSSLLPRDPGSLDLYDARVGGGFLEPESPVACEGEACQSPPAPPEFPAPASSSYNGPANVVAGKGRRCPKGKRKVRRAGKVKCVKKRRQAKGQKAAKRRARAERRAGR